MNLTDLHRRLLTDVLAIDTPNPLVITGGHAVQAHGLVDRLPRTRTWPPRTQPLSTKSSAQPATA